MNTRKKLKPGAFLCIKITYKGKDKYTIETMTESGISYKGNLRRVNKSGETTNESS